MCLGACVGAAICCAGKICCDAMCLPAKALGVASKNYAKIGYVIFDLFWILMGIISFYGFSWAADWTTVGDECDLAEVGSSACLAASGMVRISWSLAIFHFFIFCVICLRNDCAAYFHDGWWCLKFAMVLGLFVSAYWIPNDPVMIGFMKMSKWVSIVFLCYQAVLMLVVAYVLNDQLVENVNQSNG